MNNTKSVVENAGYSLKDLCLYFLKLGALGFGGPVALVGYMHRDLVVERKWINEDDYNAISPILQRLLLPWSP